MKDDNTPEIKISSDVSDVEKLRKEILNVSGGVDKLVSTTCSLVENLGCVSVASDPVHLDVDKGCCVVSNGVSGEEDSAGRESVPDEDSCCSAKDQNSPEKSVSCVVCGSVDGLKYCGGCKSTHYCSKTCQLSHWSYHSIYCQAIADLDRLEKSKRYADQSVRQNQVDNRTRLKVLKLVGDKPKIRCWLN